MQLPLSEHIDKVLAGYEVPSKLSANAAWEKLNKRIDQKSISPKGKTIRFNFFTGSVAAAIVFLVIMYVGMFKTGKYSSNYVSGTLESQCVVLPDSSLLYVNSNSLAKYHYNKFTGNRNVMVQGEVFFDVKSGKRFMVDFEGGSVKVLGTKFNVVAYTKDAINIECIEGMVEFKFNRALYTLGQGEGIKVYNDQIDTVYFFNTLNYSERLNGIYQWDKISINELFSFIGSRFAYEVEVEKSIADRNFSGKIDLSDLESGLNIVSFAMDLKYNLNEESKTISVNAKTAGNNN
ncbi:MAG TPA: FecR family protein [Prolixibacteraceae bacterium]|nr:FecR family protein [Prolixibacteraceae bacterium]